jgi:LmbE family N-acetylglucosaminyl deacetylase
MCVLAHPDDESMGFGGTLARYAAEGADTFLVTATRGERGWFGRPEDNPGLTALGQLREAELRAAARVLGLHEPVFLNYIDGELDRADHGEVVTQIAREIRRIRPDVVLSFGHDGLYGHPDHVAICQFATAAVVAAADESDPTLRAQPAHRVAKLYYKAARPETMAAYEAAFGELVMQVDGQERRSAGWTPWLITTTIDTEAYWEQVWQAVSCHRTQLPCFQALLELSADHHRYVWGTQEYYRVFSLVNSGRAIERDLFDGLRSDALRQELPSGAARTLAA